MHTRLIPLALLAVTACTLDLEGDVTGPSGPTTAERRIPNGLNPASAADPDVRWYLKPAFEDPTAWNAATKALADTPAGREVLYYAIRSYARHGAYVAFKDSIGGKHGFHGELGLGSYSSVYAASAVGASLNALDMTVYIELQGRGPLAGKVPGYLEAVYIWDPMDQVWIVHPSKEFLSVCDAGDLRDTRCGKAPRTDCPLAVHSASAEKACGPYDRELGFSKGCPDGVTVTISDFYCL